MMRHFSTAQNLKDKETTRRLRDMVLRVKTPCDGLREQSSAPCRDFATLIQRLSREIDETVLPRKFALFSDAGIEATFVVSNRRLIELEVGEKKVDFGLETEANADTVAGVCAKALRALSLRSGTLHLRPIGRASKVTAKGSTCTAQHIAEYSIPSNLENRLKAFLKASHACSLGWVYRSEDGHAVEHGPDEKIMEKLRSFQRVVMSQADYHAGLHRVKRAEPTCLAFKMTSDVQILIAEYGSDRLFAAFPNSEIIAVLTRWHQFFKLSELD